MCEHDNWDSTDSLVTETIVDPNLSPDRLVTILRERKTTGQLVFHLSQGGIQKVAVVEKTKATEEQADSIRALFEME